MDHSVLIDTIFKGQASGPVAARLLANGMNVNALRLWKEPDGRSFITNAAGKAEHIITANATLQKDEWKHLDDAVVQIARQRLVGVNDLRSRGLVYDIPNGLGAMILEYEDVGDMGAAEINMDAVTRGRSDRLEFDLNYLPLPVVHKDFQINSRVLAASRNRGMPLDVAQAQFAARKVAEKVEEILFTGASSYAFGGGTLFGYMDFTHKNDVTLSINWDDSGGTGAVILADVLAMKQASIDDQHFGPWILYVPTNYDATMDDDFKANSDLTIRDRLKQIGGIEDVKAADYLTDDNVILVEMQADTVRMVQGLDVTTVEWQTEGGMIFHFKVMAILVPQLRADQGDKCGIIHLAA